MVSSRWWEADLVIELVLIDPHTAAVDLEVLAVSLVPDQGLGTHVDLLPEALDDELAVMGLFSGLPRIETHDIIVTANRDLPDLQGRWIVGGALGADSL